MNVRGMWHTNAVTLVLLIVLNLALMAIGNVPWAILGTLALLGAMYLSFRQGMGAGHEACGILSTVQRAQDPSSPTHNQLDQQVIGRAWSVQRGLRGLFLSALIPYLSACVYIVCMLLSTGNPPLLKLGDVPVLVTRIIAWVLALPFWPLIAFWYQEFVSLEPAIVVILMATPFVLPGCYFAGYMQGPKLWKKSEEAMAQGKRRAKAKSRIIKKRSPRQQKPEI